MLTFFFCVLFLCRSRGGYTDNVYNQPFSYIENQYYQQYPDYYSNWGYNQSTGSYSGFDYSQYDYSNQTSKKVEKEDNEKIEDSSREDENSKHATEKLDVAAANRQFMEASEELYDALIDCHWPALNVSDISTA